ncbi:MAG: RNA polymerase sigma factor [Bacteroidota bacterium]
MTEYSAQDDLELVQMARQGDKAAFSALVHRHEPVVAATVKGMLGNGEDAEDVGQNVFIRFYHALGDFRGDAALPTYLTRIAINLSLNELRRRQRRRLLFMAPSDGEVRPEQGLQVDEEQSRDTGEAVDLALQKLPPKYRSVVVLRMIQGYSTKETAKILSLPQGTVLSRLARAQEKLKELLKHLIG